MLTPEQQAFEQFLAGTYRKRWWKAFAKDRKRLLQILGYPGESWQGAARNYGWPDQWKVWQGVLAAGGEVPIPPPVDIFAKGPDGKALYPNRTGASVGILPSSKELTPAEQALAVNWVLEKMHTQGIELAQAPNPYAYSLYRYACTDEDTQKNFLDKFVAPKFNKQKGEAEVAQEKSLASSKEMILSIVSLAEATAPDPRDLSDAEFRAAATVLRENSLGRVATFLERHQAARAA